MSITLTLNNFKKYDIKTSFTLPLNGLVLIQGASGIGKTSILDAIYFVLYGIGSKIVNFSSTNCSVVWDDGKTVITRTKKPGRLTLKEQENTYEDAVAQEIINNRYGTNFEITSYIKYKASTSFFSLGPSARMEFLQKIAIKGTDVLVLKNKTKEAIKNRKERLLKISSELKVVEEEFNGLSLPETVQFPFGKFHETKIKNHQIKSKNNKIKLSNAEKSLKLILKKSGDFDLQKQSNKFIAERISEYSKILKELQDQKEHNKFIDLTNFYKRLDILEKNRQYNELQMRISDMENRLREYKNSEDQKRSEELEKLTNIHIIEDKIEYYLDLYNTQKTILQTKSRLEHDKILLQTFGDITPEYLETLQIHLQNSTGKKFTCPNCSCDLLLKDEKLQLNNGIQSLEDVSIDNLKIRIQTAKDRLKKKSQLESNIERDEKFLHQHSDFDIDCDYELILKTHTEKIKIQDSILRDIKKLQTTSYSPSVQKLQSDITWESKRLSTLEKIVIEDENKYTIEELKDIINKNKIQNDKYSEINKKIDDILVSIQKEETKFLYLEDQNYPEKIISIEEEIKNFKVAINENQKDEILLDKYLKYMDIKSNYDRWRTKFLNLQAQEKNGVKSLEVAEKFLSILNATESKAISNIINSLNIQLKYYSEQFFTEPIAIQIQPFKESLNGNIKPSVQIKVSYKGMDYDIDCLSGGETSRVELAVCLAINSVINGKILLLDEVLGTLNSGYIDAITGILREEALKENKLILTVLHGSSEGNFDNVINIE